MGRPPGRKTSVPLPSQWRAASLRTYEITTDMIGAWDDGFPAPFKAHVAAIRALHEPLLIQAGLIGDGDRL